MTTSSDAAPIDRASSNLAALRAIESLIGQIEQPETSGSDLAILLSLIIEDLGEAVDDLHKQTRNLRIA